MKAIAALPSNMDRTADSDRSPAARELRVGIVGAGRMAQHHVRAIVRGALSARVVAVADPSAAARAAALSLASGAQGFASPADLLAAAHVDVVHVCTPPAAHEEATIAALEAGCHVYVEKPFAPTSAAAERVLELAGARGLKVCAGHQLLYEAPARGALALLPAVGRLAHLESYFSFRTVRRGPDGRLPLRPDLQLLDILPHPVYVLLHFLEAAKPEARSELTALEIGPAGTVHALVRRGSVTGTLVVTLEGRPIESYLRLVGSNGHIHADFVRGTVQRLLGPGTSGIDKLLNPYRLSRQLLAGTTAALARRALRRQRSYPGLAEIFGAFYAAIRSDGPSPVSRGNILDTVRICEAVANALAKTGQRQAPGKPAPSARVLVTGGTGLLGRELVSSLERSGISVRALARRLPAGWERTDGAEYVAADLSQPVDPALLEGIETVVHCAAATAGGWDEHRAHSIRATENLLRAAAAAGTRRIVHVSSLAVLAQPRNGAPVTDDMPLEENALAKGPYVWGKLESERLAVELGRELHLEVKVVRPGALVDHRHFEPPGRLGRRIGNLFVAAGSPRDRLGVVDVGFAARVLTMMVARFDTMPATLNLLAPELPTKRELVSVLRRTNPDLRIVWLPGAVLLPMSWLAVQLQRALRPRRTPLDLAKVFAAQRYDTSRIASLVQNVAHDGSTGTYVEDDRPSLVGFAAGVGAACSSRPGETVSGTATPA